MDRTHRPDLAAPGRRWVTSPGPRAGVGDTLDDIEGVPDALAPVLHDALGVAEAVVVPEGVPDALAPVLHDALGVSDGMLADPLDDRVKE